MVVLGVQPVHARRKKDVKGQREGKGGFFGGDVMMRDGFFQEDIIEDGFYEENDIKDDFYEENDIEHQLYKESDNKFSYKEKFYEENTIKDMYLDGKRHSKRDVQGLMSNVEEELDVLFAVAKAKGGFYPRSFVRKRVVLGIEALSRTLTLRIVKVADNECQKTVCAHGHCEDQILLDPKQVVTVADAQSFVSLHFRHRAQCICPEGYAGPICATVVNQCAHQPCPVYTRCKPSPGPLGYQCRCPPGKVGALCSVPSSSCGGRTDAPSCYVARAPLSLGGASFLMYQLHVPIERHLSFSVWFRTRHSSGTLMYAGGSMDYGLLQLSGGRMEYQWELGSGAGRVLVQSKPLNDSLWHHVHLERIGPTARLTVDHSLKGEGRSPGKDEMLNLEKPTLYLGAVVHPSLPPSRPLIGCLDAPMVYDTPLPTSAEASPTATLQKRVGVTPHCYSHLGDPGSCGSHPCQNGGTCQEMKGGGFQCSCPLRFKGLTCSLDSDPCASSPCLHHGRCVNTAEGVEGEGGFICQCPVKVSGARCQHKHCRPHSPCNNGAHCEEGVTGAVCRCRGGFAGLTCDLDVDECLVGRPCPEGARCLNTHGAFRCDCPVGMRAPECAARPHPPLFNNFTFVSVLKKKNR